MEIEFDTCVELSDEEIDQIIEEYENNCRKKRKANSYKRKQIDQRKLKKLRETGDWTLCGYREDTKHRRYYYSGRKRYAKQMTNRKLRRIKDAPPDGGGYRKVFDYWNTVF